jgi:hypothetical protein
MFDMRAPDWGTPANELYRAAIDMTAFADEIGVDRINVMEHHGSDDGYVPQPFTLAAGMAAVTTKIRLLLGAVILPLHDPRDVEWAPRGDLRRRLRAIRVRDVREVVERPRQAHGFGH